MITEFRFKIFLHNNHLTLNSSKLELSGTDAWLCFHANCLPVTTRKRFGSRSTSIKLISLGSRNASTLWRQVVTAWKKLTRTLSPPRLLKIGDTRYAGLSGKLVTMKFLSWLEWTSTPESRSNVLHETLLNISSELCTILKFCRLLALFAAASCSQLQSILPSFLNSKLHWSKSRCCNATLSFTSSLSNVARV